MLIDVRIICAHEARDAAQTLRRLLTAEGHKVEVSSGRSSLSLISGLKARGEAVIVIWSERAEAAQYPQQWAQAAPPERLIELAFCAAPPAPHGRAGMIDFTGWRGQRSETACWQSLQESLRAAATTTEPAKPEPRAAALVLAGFSLAAAAAAIWARMEAQHAPLQPTQEAATVSAPLFEEPRTSADAQGGPLNLREPDDYAPDADVQPLEQPGMLERAFGRERRDTPDRNAH